MKLSKSEKMYSLIAFNAIFFALLFSIETTFTYFSDNYWFHSFTVMVILGGAILYHINKNISKYGLLAFGITFFLIPLCAFDLVPKYLHYLHIVSVKNVTLKGVVTDKYYGRRGVKNPHSTFIEIETKIQNYPLKPIIIKTKINYIDFNHLKINDKIKFKGTLSKVGFDFEGLVK